MRACSNVYRFKLLFLFFVRVWVFFCCWYMCVDHVYIESRLLNHITEYSEYPVDYYILFFSSSSFPRSYLSSCIRSIVKSFSVVQWDFLCHNYFDFTPITYLCVCAYVCMSNSRSYAINDFTFPENAEKKK